MADRALLVPTPISVESVSCLASMLRHGFNHSALSAWLVGNPIAVDPQQLVHACGAPAAAVPVRDGCSPLHHLVLAVFALISALVLAWLVVVWASVNRRDPKPDDKLQLQLQALAQQVQEAQDVAEHTAAALQQAVDTALNAVHARGMAEEARRTAEDALANAAQQATDAAAAASLRLQGVEQTAARVLHETKEDAATTLNLALQSSAMNYARLHERMNDFEVASDPSSFGVPPQTMLLQSI